MFWLLRHTKLIFGEVRVAFIFPVFMLCSAILVCSVTLAAPAPVIDAAAQGPAISNLEKRINRIETRLNNQGLVDLMKRFDQLQRDMQRIIGDLEVQNHQLQSMKQQQKDLYNDIDRRLRKLEQSAQAAPAPTTSLSGGAPTSPVPVAPAAGVVSDQKLVTQSTAPVTQQAATAAKTMSEVERNVARSAYERAFNLLKQSRYDLAITSFKAFLETYPDASYADNAQYWLGEANYATKHYKVALSEFKKVIDNYPNSPKRADAMLKIGYTYVELGDKQQAMQVLNTIVSSYPDSTAARLAQKRIKTLK